MWRTAQVVPSMCDPKGGGTIICTLQHACQLGLCSRVTAVLQHCHKVVKHNFFCFASLPPAVLYSLLTVATNKHPLPPSPPTIVSPEAYFAHILYNVWAIRFLCHGNLATPSPRDLLWDGTCASQENIFSLVRRSSNYIY